MNKEDNKLSPSAIDEVILAKAKLLNEQGSSTTATNASVEQAVTESNEESTEEQHHTVSGTEATVKELKGKNLPIPGVIEASSTPLAYPLDANVQSGVVPEQELFLSGVLFKLFFCIFGIFFAISLLQKQILQYLIDNQLITLNGNLYTSTYLSFSTNLPEYLLYFTLGVLPIFLIITVVAAAVDYVSNRKINIAVRFLMLLVSLAILGALGGYFLTSIDINILDFIRTKFALLSIVIELH